MHVLRCRRGRDRRSATSKSRSRTTTGAGFGKLRLRELTERSNREGERLYDDDDDDGWMDGERNEATRWRGAMKSSRRSFNLMK